MAELPIEKKFEVLCEIVRAQHFAWRDAVAELCPDVDAAEIAMRMWEITGRKTAEAYLKRIDPTRPLAQQVAAGIAWSSQCMGEDAVAEPGAGDDEAYVRHAACPWQRWHERLRLLAEDRPGCDAWFRATLETMGRALSVDLRFETLEALPEGGRGCVRRLWVERSGER